MAKSKAKKSTSTREQSGWRQRCSRIVLLPDQGAPVTVSLSELGVQTGRDSSWNGYANNFIRANSASIKALDLEPIFSSTPDEVTLSLKANGVIGAVPLRAPDSQKTIGGIVVNPRYGWNSIGSLMSSIGWSACPEILNMPLIPGSATNIPSWVIAGPAVTRLEALLQCSRPKFRLLNDVRQTPRGRIDWTEYASRHASRGFFHEFPCTFSDLEADLVLRRYVKWALEKIKAGLYEYSHSDVLARRLFERIQGLLISLASVNAELPDRRTIEGFQRRLAASDPSIGPGIEALNWIIDERGLAGTFNLDGLSWRLTMHELFEQWVETLVRHWGAGFGATVVSGRTSQTITPIRWNTSRFESLSTLIPDVVLKTTDETFIFDAKYKGFLDETDELRWRHTIESLRDDHRHDVHQVLAYSSLYNTDRITVVLVYPLLPETWQRAVERSMVDSQGLVIGDRQISIALCGVPVGMPDGQDLTSITKEWEYWRVRDASRPV